MSTAYEYLMACASEGREANFNGRTDRRLEAAWIRELLLRTCLPTAHTDATQHAPATGFQALRIRGATVVGPLDLAWCGSIGQPLPSLTFRQCIFEHTAEPDGDSPCRSIDLSNAHLGGLELKETQLTHLYAVGARIVGSVTISKLGATAPGAQCWCNLSSAVIDGHVFFDSVQLRAPKYIPIPAENKFGRGADFTQRDFAINLYMSRIAGSILFLGQSSIWGAIFMDAIRVEGDIRIDHANISACGHDFSIAMANARIRGDLAMVGNYCEGPIWMYRASIAGSLNFEATKIERGRFGEDPDKQDISLYAFAASVGVRCELRALETSASICLQSLHAGCLNVEDVTCEGAPRPPWVAPPVWIPLSHASASPQFALDVRGAQIDANLSFNKNTFWGGVDLSEVRCGTLEDDKAGYGNARPIVVEGMRYERIKQTKFSLEERVKAGWLPINESHHTPQPFVQFAQVLVRHGDSPRARDVLLCNAKLEARERWWVDHCDVQHQTRFSFPLLWLHRLLYGVFLRPYGLCFGFGLLPGRALLTLVIAIVVGSFGFESINAHGGMVVAMTPVASYVNIVKGHSQFVTMPVAGAWPGRLACGENIQPLVYALDVFLPIVDLREEGKCDIGAAQVPSPPPDWKISAYQGFKTLYAILGWVVTTLSLLTFSGVMRHRLLQD